MTSIPPGPRSRGDALWTRRFASPPAGIEAVLLVDFGSTYTKLTAVAAESGRLLGIAQHPTTVDSDLFLGFDAAREGLTSLLNDPNFVDILACSSAGGGLRLAVVGLEPELTAEAARRAALNAGARVVTMINHGLTALNLGLLIDGRPDIVLLAGGTNGGNATVLLESARVLAASEVDVPVVLAGNESAQPAASDLMKKRGKHVVTTPNLMPEIGVIQEGPVREAIRTIFIEHVIGGKHLSSTAEFGAMVLMPTPDAVLRAAELLATGVGQEPGLGDLLIIDLGGATTDVHSVVRIDGRTGYTHELVASAIARRTVEADLGLRWNATGILDAAMSELGLRDVSHLRDATERRAADPHLVAETATEMDADLELAGYAIEIAIRRHAGHLTIELSPMGSALRKSGRDLRAISTIVLSGGIFRHAAADSLMRLRPTHADDGLMLPQHPRFAVDRAYLLAAAGLLSTRNPEAALTLMNQELMYLSTSPKEGSQCSVLN